jgi:hypothetical protein
MGIEVVATEDVVAREEVVATEEVVLDEHPIKQLIKLTTSITTNVMRKIFFNSTSPFLELLLSQKR